MKKIILFILTLILLTNFVNGAFSTNPNDYLIYNTTTTITGEKTIDTLPLTHDSIYSCWINVTSIDSGQVWRMNFQDAIPTFYFGTQIVESTPSWKKIINGVFTEVTTGGDGSGATIKMTVDESVGSNDWLQVYDGALSKKIDVNESITSASSITVLYGGDSSNSNISAYCWNGTQDQRPTAPTIFSITAISDWNNSNTLLNFSADINGTIYNTTNGTIITNIFDNSTSLYNITIFADNWFNRTYLNYNVISNLIAILNQTSITINFIFSNGDLVNFTNINFTGLLSGNEYNISTGKILISPDANNITFSIRDDGTLFNNFTYSFNFTILENSTYNITINENHNILTFLNANTSTAIENATIIVNYPSGKTLNLTTNSTGQINFSYNYNGSLEFGDYSFDINKTGFLNTTINEILNTSNVPFIKTYNITRAKITINIYDRETGLVLSGVNVSVAFIDLFNKTTDTGILEIVNLSIVSRDYIIYASADGYKIEIRTFNYTNQEELTIDFYLLNLTTPTIGKLFVTTTDSFFRKITGAKVSLLEYSPSSLSFISISECLTNINAECSFNIELNTKIYYISSTAIIGDSVFIAETSTDGEIITTTNEIRNLIFYTRTDFTVNSIYNLIYSISQTFLSNISAITVQFSSIDGTSEEVCIEYFLKVGASYTSVTGDTYCLASTSAIQNIGTSVTLNRSNDYEARIYVKEASGNQPLKTYPYPSKTSIGEVFNEDLIGALVMILWILILTFCLYAKNMTLFFILSIIISWAEFIIFPFYTIVSISVFKTIMASSTIFIARSKKDN